jgi:hypothetical protein
METTDLVEVGEFKLNLPAWFYVRTKDFGNPNRSVVWYKLVNPLSTARNLATRKKQKSVELERSGIEKPEIEDNSMKADDLPVYINRFSAYDQKRLQKYLRKDKEDKFAINPVIQRGRPEQMPKNILFNKTFKGYDQPYLDLVDNVKRGRIIPKLTTDLKQKKTVFEGDEMPSETSSQKTTTTENEKIYDALMDLLGDQEEVKSAMSIADIPTPSTAYMISRLPENMKKTKSVKAKSVKSEVSFPSSISSLGSNPLSSESSNARTRSKKAAKKDMTIEEALKIVGLKNPNQPFGELEGETFPMPKGTKGFERLYR